VDHRGLGRAPWKTAGPLEKVSGSEAWGAVPPGHSVVLYTFFQLETLRCRWWQGRAYICDNVWNLWTLKRGKGRLYWAL